MSDQIRTEIDYELKHDTAELVRALRSAARDMEREAHRIEKSDLDTLWVDAHLASNMIGRFAPALVRLSGAIGKRDALALMALLEERGES